MVLENMASVGNIVGGRLWHLRYIIDRVTDKSRIGFCIDTCHLFSSGGGRTHLAQCQFLHCPTAVISLAGLEAKA